MNVSEYNGEEFKKYEAEVGALIANYPQEGKKA